MMLNNERMKKLMEQSRLILERADQGMSTRDIMAHIYVENLEGKTLEQGQLMADAIIESVASFDSQYADAKADMDDFLTETLTAITKGMEPAERCTCWIKIAAAVTAASETALEAGTYDREQILAEVEALEIQPDQVTPELEKELFDQAKAAIANSNVMLSALLAEAETLEQIESSNAAAGLMLDLGSREIDYRAIASMIAYTDIKNGTIEDVPVDMKLEQITTMVCAGIEQTRIANEVEEGRMSLEVAHYLLRALGAVTLICLLSAAIIGTHMLVAALTCGMYAYPVTRVAAIMMSWATYEAYVGWEKLSDRIVNEHSAQAKSVGRGVRRICDYIRNNLLAGAVNGIKTAWDWLRRTLSGMKKDAGNDQPVEGEVILELPPA